MSTAAAARQKTLLGALMRQRGLTRERTIGVLERRARELGDHGFSLSLRQLDRWLAGEVETEPRLSAHLVVEDVFGHPMEVLLAPCGVLPSAGTGRVGAEPRQELRTEDFVVWLAEHSGVEVGAVWKAVSDGANEVETTPRPERIAAERRKAGVSREQIAEAVASYYANPDGLYRAGIGGWQAKTSIFSHAEWTGLDLPLSNGGETATVVGYSAAPFDLPPGGQQAAIRRLAAAEVDDTVMVNDLLYRLVDVRLAEGSVATTFAVAEFAQYALTNDLLEGELVEHLTQQEGKSLLLRDLYLPSVDFALDFAGRCCVGGPACLTAIARPGGDYVLVVQQRSSRVLNVTGRLAVIPKAFHQPMVDTFAEAPIRSSVERELEEELLGREDLDQLAAEARRRVAPRHPLSSSAPAAWLMDHSDAWRLECTAFGVNLVNGNYEFACLLIIDDPRWWELHGHQVEANWETMHLDCRSSLDTEGLERLTADPRWSNEGLFAFVEGLRRLKAIGADRVAAPDIERIL
jgi:hypothetical protein